MSVRNVKKLWVDIINPSDVFFFKALMSGLSDYEINVTTRNRAETVGLTNLFNIANRVIGRDYDDPVRKTLSAIQRIIDLVMKVPQFDFSLSFENAMFVAASELHRRPSILYCDNDLKFIQKKALIQDIETKVKSLSDYIIIPSVCYENFKKIANASKLLSFDGYKEEVYIADFAPDPDFLSKLPFKELAGSFLSIALTSQPYVRPQGYFICTILAVAVLAAEILLLPNREGATGFALAKVIAIALSLVWSQYLIFSTVLGVDPWWHQAFTTKILESAHIPEGYKYSKLPLMHLTVATTSLITGLNYKMASIFSISLLQVVCNLAFVFLLGKLIYSAKAGLLAALVLGTANHHINFSWAPIPTTMAAILIPIKIFLLFKLRREKEKRLVATSLVLLFFGILILTHTVTALCMALLLLGFWVGAKIYDWLFRERDLTPAFNLSLVNIFVVAMLGWWTYSRHVTYLVSAVQTITPPEEVVPPGEPYLVNYWTYDLPAECISNPKVNQYMASTAFPAELFFNLGMVLFFSLSLLAVFYLISRKGISKNSFVICLSSLIPLGMGFFPNYFNQGLLHRWTYFSQILLAIPLGVFFLLIYGMRRDLAIDPCFLAESSSYNRIISLAREINHSMPRHVLNLVKELLGDMHNATVSVFGVAYKGDVEDTRETPAIRFIKLAENEGYKIKAYDP